MTAALIDRILSMPEMDLPVLLPAKFHLTRALEGSQALHISTARVAVDSADPCNLKELRACAKVNAELTELWRSLLPGG